MLCLFGSELNSIFHWWAQLLMVSRSSFIWTVEKYLLSIFENRDVQSANVLQIEVTLFGKSFMYIIKHKSLLEHQLIYYSTRMCDHPKLFFVYFVIFFSSPLFLVWFAEDCDMQQRKIYLHIWRLKHIKLYQRK